MSIGGSGGSNSNYQTTGSTTSYSPDFEYLQDLYAYEMYGPGAITGRQYGLNWRPPAFGETEGSSGTDGYEWGKGNLGVGEGDGYGGDESNRNRGTEDDHSEGYRDRDGNWQAYPPIPGPGDEGYNPGDYQDKPGRPSKYNVTTDQYDEDGGYSDDEREGNAELDRMEREAGPLGKSGASVAGGGGGAPRDPSLRFGNTSNPYGPEKAAYDAYMKTPQGIEEMAAYSQAQSNQYGERALAADAGTDYTGYTKGADGLLYTSSGYRPSSHDPGVGSQNYGGLANIYGPDDQKFTGVDEFNAMSSEERARYQRAFEAYRGGWSAQAGRDSLGLGQFQPNQEQIAAAAGMYQGPQGDRTGATPSSMYDRPTVRADSMAGSPPTASAPPPPPPDGGRTPAPTDRGRTPGAVNTRQSAPVVGGANPNAPPQGVPIGSVRQADGTWLAANGMRFNANGTPWSGGPAPVGAQALGSGVPGWDTPGTMRPTTPDPNIVPRTTPTPAPPRSIPGSGLPRTPGRPITPVPPRTAPRPPVTGPGGITGPRFPGDPGGGNPGGGGPGGGPGGGGPGGGTPPTMPNPDQPFTDYPYPGPPLGPNMPEAEPITRWGQGGASGNRLLTGGTVYDIYSRMAQNPGYSDQAKNAMSQSAMNAASAQTATQAARLQRQSYATGNSAGYGSNLANINRAGAGAMAGAARGNIIDQEKERIRQREMAASGLGKLYSEEGAYFQSLMGGRQALATMPLSDKTRTEGRTHAAEFHAGT